MLSKHLDTGRSDPVLWEITWSFIDYKYDGLAYKE